MLNGERKFKTKGVIIMCKACEVGKIVVNKCIAKGISINTQKLQKLLVLMQHDYACRTSKKLFKEDIVIWSCGVAIKEVDADFRENAIRFSEPQVEHISLLEKELDSVNRIIDEYGHMSASDISQLSVVKDIISNATPTFPGGTPHISAKKMTEIYGKHECAEVY